MWYWCWNDATRPEKAVLPIWTLISKVILEKPVKFYFVSKIVTLWLKTIVSWSIMIVVLAFICEANVNLIGRQHKVNLIKWCETAINLVYLCKPLVPRTIVQTVAKSVPNKTYFFWGGVIIRIISLDFLLLRD